MPQRPSARLSAALALGVIASFLSPLPATADDAAEAAALVAEVRQKFTLEGKTIPPKIFRDFGDGDMADSGDIWVTVDLKAAIGSNLYFDEIKQDGSWIRQKSTSNETTGYTMSARPRTACWSSSRRSAAAALAISCICIFSMSPPPRLRLRRQPLPAHQSHEPAQHSARRPLGWRDQHRQKYDHRRDGTRQLHR